MAVAVSQEVHRKRINDEGQGENNIEEKKPRLSGEDFKKMKEELRNRKKRLRAIPRIRLKFIGELAKLDLTETDCEQRMPIFLSDVQHLLLYSVLGHHSPYSPARWCTLEKFNKLTQTVVLVIEGLSSEHFMSNQSLFPNISSLLQHKLEVVTPSINGCSIIDELAAVPLTGSEYKKILKKFGSLEFALQHSGDVVKRLRTVFPLRAPTKADGQTYSPEELSQLPSTDKFPRTQLLLSPMQLVEENYPLPLKGALSKKYSHYVFTKEEYVEATPKSPMFAVDCEMCRTHLGLELTRISLVNEQMETIYDTLVRPENAIIDYLTQWSGITPEKLKNVTTTLKEVQQHLQKILPSDAILVGQSLNADLNAMQMLHPYVIDTSFIYNLTGDRYKKPKLKLLSKLFLNEVIQNNAKEGHCSTEDSIACMKLVQLKLRNSIDFGDGVLNDKHCINVQNIDQLPKQELKEQFREEFATSFFKYVTEQNSNCALVGNGDVIEEYSRFLKAPEFVNGGNRKKKVSLEILESNKKAIAKTKELSPNHQFNLCHLRVTEDQLKEETLEKTLKSVDKWVHKLWQNSSPLSLVCVVFGGQIQTATGAVFLNIKKTEFDEIQT